MEDVQSLSEAFNEEVLETYPSFEEQKVTIDATRQQRDTGLDDPRCNSLMKAVSTSAPLALSEITDCRDTWEDNRHTLINAEVLKDDILLEWGTLERYRIDRNRRMAVVIQMTNFSPELTAKFGLTPRLDAEVDGTKLSKCLTQIGFDVRHVRDANRAEILDLVTKYVTDKPSCFFLALTTHAVVAKAGTDQERLAAYDALLTREELISCLEGEGLKKVPKILIFQAALCAKPAESSELSGAFNTLRRSTSSLRRSNANKTDATRPLALPTCILPDLLVVSSAINQYCQFKNVKSGSEFLQRFVHAALDFNAKKPSLDFEKLMTRINGQFVHRNYVADSSPGLFDPHHPSPNWAACEKPRYTLSIVSTLTKQLFLFE